MVSLENHPLPESNSNKFRRCLERAQTCIRSNICIRRISSRLTCVSRSSRSDTSSHLIQVLNCEDYHFREYITGADIILQDTYPIGINASYSIVYDTPCTLDYGDCGCDNCVGDGVADVARRLDGLYNRLYWDGRKGMPVWTVVQSFGNET